MFKKKTKNKQKQKQKDDDDDDDDVLWKGSNKPHLPPKICIFKKCLSELNSFGAHSVQVPKKKQKNNFAVLLFYAFFSPTQK